MASEQPYLHALSMTLANGRGLLVNKSIFLALAAAVAFVIGAPATCRAMFDLGQAANYAVISDPGTTTVQINNSLFNGNFGVAANPVMNYMDSSNAIIIGNLDFAGTAASGITATVTGSIRSNVSAVTSGYSTIVSLGTQFTMETGTQLTTETSITASSGMLDGSGNRVFQISSHDFLNNGTFTITGSASDYVVINVQGNQNVSLKNDLLLTGGITSDHVFINIETDKGLGGNTNGGPINATIFAPNATVNVDHTLINGHFYGGDGNSFQLVSGMTINNPDVPEPSPLVLTAVSALGFISLGLWRRRKG
jgi:choice-of-anchor A domain-containing protein